jgi:hypothetical protein
MADDIVLNPGVGGATVGADLIAGVSYQPIKLIHGINDVNDGDVARTNPLPIRQNGTTTALANVAANAGSVTVLASNANRLRAWLYNDADKSVYVKFGAGATAASFTKKLLPDEFFAVEFYTGIIDAVWEAAPTGNLRVTELTA